MESYFIGDVAPFILVRSISNAGSKALSMADVTGTHLLVDLPRCLTSSAASQHLGSLPIRFPLRMPCPKYRTMRGWTVVDSLFVVFFIQKSKTFLC